MSEHRKDLIEQLEDTLKWNMEIYGPLYLDASLSTKGKEIDSSIKSPSKLAKPDLDISPSSDDTDKTPAHCTSLVELRELANQDASLYTDLPSTKLVFGSGPDKTDVMLIGEAPGEEENRQGIPFVGAAGQLLTKMLKAISIDRREVYITNILKHRPPNNRNPKADEVAHAMPYLIRQIELVQPKIILCLGKQAANALLGNDESLKNMRQQAFNFQKTPMHVTYHPAALLRNSQWKRPAWEDLQHFQKQLETL